MSTSKGLRKLRSTRTLLLSSILIAASGLTSAAEIKLKYSDHDPNNGMRTNFVQNVWLKEINNQLGDRVSIQEFWGGSLFGSKEILKGIGDNITQIGFMYPGHYPGQLPAHTIFKLLPKGPKKFSNMVWFYRTIYEEVPAFEAELKKANVKPLLLTAGLPAAFVGTTSLESIDDITGRKWRAGDKWSLRFLGNVGAHPVSIPWSDTYMALQTGAINGCYTNLDGAHMMKFDETAPNVLVSKSLWNGIPFMHMVNRRTFENMPEDVQDALLKASKIAEEKYSKVYEDTFEQIIQTQKDSGVKVTFMSDEDIDKWENSPKLIDLQSQWVNEAKKAGLDNAEEILTQVKAIYERAMARS
ncbi:TRAP transporter substrate-binding protein DctP [Photobacterium sp. DNB23_23_1]